MPTTTVRVAYWPVRVGFLVRAGSLDDLTRAATLATLIWGGIRNPIIPLSDDDGETDRLIAIWQVDALFAVDAEDDLSRRTIARHGHLRLPGSLGARGLFEPVGDDELGAVDVRMQISHYRNETYRHGQESAVALPAWSTDDHLAPLWTVLFGDYGDEQPGPRFRKAFVERLRALGIEISGDLSPQLAVFGNPLNLTGAGLVAFASSFRRDGLVLGDPANPEHLRHFWNLRSLGISVAFGPLEDGLRCRRFCQAHVKQIPTSEDDFGLCLWKCGGWAQGEKPPPGLSGALPEGIQPVRAALDEGTWSQPSYRPAIWATRSESVLASVEKTRWGTRRMVFPLQAGRPYPESRIDFLHAHWIVQVSPLTEFSYEPGTIRLPALPDLNEWASQKLTAQRGALRLTGRSVDFFAHHRDSSLDLSLPGQGDVVRKIFDRAGVSASLSSAGDPRRGRLQPAGGSPARLRPSCRNSRPGPPAWWPSAGGANTPGNAWQPSPAGPGPTATPPQPRRSCLISHRSIAHRSHGCFPRTRARTTHLGLQRQAPVTGYPAAQIFSTLREAQPPGRGLAPAPQPSSGHVP